MSIIALCRYVPMPDYVSQLTRGLFGYIVGAGEETPQDGQAHGLRSPEPPWRPAIYGYGH
jgi:hypothetical protein